MSSQQQMTIENVSVSDIGKLKELAKSTILDSVDAGIDIKKAIITDTENHIEGNLPRSDRVFLKYTDETILGFILIQKFWNLSDLFVLPSAQGNGVGKQLFDEAKAACTVSGGDIIRVNSSLNAEGFYRKVGFVTYVPNTEVPDFIVPLIYKF